MSRDHAGVLTLDSGPPASSATQIPPIHRLAAETLMQIFQEVAADDVPVDAPGCAHARPGWYVLAWVCARWRYIVHGDSILWANSYSHSLRRASTALSLSKSIPLVYELSADMPRIALEINLQSNLEADNTFAADTPLERCRYIRVADGRGDVVEHITRLADLSARVRLPVLEELQLETFSWLWAGNKAQTLVSGLGDAFTIFAEKLRVARFVNCYTTVDSPTLDKFLLAFDSYYQVRPSIESLYNGLLPMAGGTLTELALFNATDGEKRLSGFSHTAEPIHFPKLQRIRLHGFTPQVAELLRIFSWPKRGTRVRLRVITSDGQEESAAEQALILSLVYPRDAPWRILRAEHIRSHPVFDVTVVETWHTRPPRSYAVSDTQVAFEGGIEPCAWWGTIVAAIPFIGEKSIQVFKTLLEENDYYMQDIPWAKILSSMTGLRAIHPWHQIMGSVGPVQEDGLLGRQFKERVVGLTVEHSVENM